MKQDNYQSVSNPDYGYQKETKQTQEDHIGQQAYQRYQTPTLYWLNIISLVIAYIVLIGYALNFLPLIALRPIPTLIMAIYLHMMNPSGLTVPNFVKYGLVVDAIGDILFIFPSNMLAFKIALACYMIGNLLYIKAYWTDEPYRTMQSPMTCIRIIMICVLCIIFIFQMVRLMDYFPNKLFFFICSLVVTAMMISSTFRYERTVDKSFYMIRIGSLLFGISNAILVFFKFRFTKFNDGDNINVVAMVVIVLSYYAAQYLIMHGSLYHKKGEQKSEIRD